MTSVVVSAAETASERVYALVGSPIPTVMTRLRHTPLRFSLTAQPARKIRVAA
ncbi:hypothetical protein GCM10011498_03360 [Amylibacter cionae]|uniref:Uncharacterized protein n=2 Tax=Neptunicoccus cionae TaxID=2035344 RepID=A0A916QRS6_9RHOB|nr:hypothetical protein GCM10011498_03360 [Amylibacter cionae]